MLEIEGAPDVQPLGQSRKQARPLSVSLLQLNVLIYLKIGYIMAIFVLYKVEFDYPLRK